MASHKNKLSELNELIENLNKDRAWLLEQLDKGCWPEFRPELAALERELGQLLIRASEYSEEYFKQIQKGMSSVSGINGELSHLTLSLSKGAEELFFVLDSSLKGTDDDEVGKSG